MKFQPCPCHKLPFSRFLIRDWSFSLGLRKTLGAVLGLKTGKKIPKRFPNPGNLLLWLSPGSRAGIPTGASLDPPFVCFWGYLGSHWDRTIPGVLGSPWRILGEFSPFWGFFGKLIPSFYSLWEPLGCNKSGFETLECFPLEFS